MARIRSIKPEIRISEKVNSWPVEVRYFWIMLWGYCDDYGRGRDNAKLIVADTYPLDDDVTHKDVEKWLGILEGSGVIHRYAVAGSNYLCITNWSEHQRPSHPARSVIPEPIADSSNPPEVSGNPPEDLAKVSANGSPEQGAVSSEQRAGEQKKRSSPQPIPADFTVTDDMRSWAVEVTPAVNLATNTTEFVDHWKSDGSKKADWTRAWKNNMKRKQEWAERAGWKPAALDLNNPANWK